ncbi:hypothetical protein ACETU7_12950 [Rhodococcus sp. 3Y1]
MRVLTLAVLACLAVAGCSVGAQTTGPVAAPNPMAANEASPADWSLGTPVPDEVDDSEMGTGSTAAPTSWVRRPPCSNRGPGRRSHGGSPLRDRYSGCYGAYATVEGLIRR